MTTYFWYVEDSLGNKTDGLTILNVPIDKDNYEIIKNNLFDDLKEKYPQFDRRTLSLKVLSKLG